MSPADWLSDPWLHLVAFVVAIVSTARALRLITHDDYPLTSWIRVWWVNHVNAKWETLFLCPFCLAPYAVAVQLAWMHFSGLNGWWWLLNGWAAVSYLAAILVAYDQPE